MMIYLKLSAKVIMNSYKNVYILGIGGTGMSSIAKYMSQAGFNVGGYDQRKSYITNTLEQESINIDFDLEDITYDKDTLYIYSTAFILALKLIYLQILKVKTYSLVRSFFRN